MTINLQQSAVLFNNYRAALFECFPNTKWMVEEQVAKLVDCSVAPVDEIWRALWDKPIFAWRKTQSSEDMVRGAEPILDGAWAKCGSYSEFSITQIDPKVRKGKGIYDPENYRNIGRSIDLLYNLREGSITYYVSWKIVKAGKFLRERAASHKAPFDFLAGMTRNKAVARLRKEFGKGWGPITCLHFLADLGMAYKPDQHVTRTGKALGLFSFKDDVPNEKKAVQINDLLDQLLPLVYPNSSPENRRRFDKTLMEISRTKLLPYSLYKEKANTLWDGGEPDIKLWDLRGGLPLK